MVPGQTWHQDYRLYEDNRVCNEGNFWVGEDTLRAVTLDLGSGNAIAPQQVRIYNCPSVWSKITDFSVSGSQ